MFNIHNIDLIYNSNTNSSGFNSLKDLIPIDFDEIAGKKGHRYRDDLSKLCLYLSRKCIPCNVDNPDDYGVIMATGYGNFKHGLSINTLASNNSGKFSAQLFPNGTFSSSSSIVSIDRGLQGMNLTIDSSDFGFFKALNIAHSYIRRGLVNNFIILTGDDFHQASYLHNKRFSKKDLFLCSSVGSIMISGNKKSDIKITNPVYFDNEKEVNLYFESHSKIQKKIIYHTNKKVDLNTSNAILEIKNICKEMNAKPHLLNISLILESNNGKFAMINLLRNKK